MADTQTLQDALNKLNTGNTLKDYLRRLQA